MAKPICPNCGAKVTAAGGEPWSLWKINRGSRLCTSCHASIQFRRSSSTIYLRVPAILLFQSAVGVAIAWGPLTSGSVQLGQAKLIVAAIVMGPLLLSIVALLLLPGSVYERSNAGG